MPVVTVSYFPVCFSRLFSDFLFFVASSVFSGLLLYFRRFTKSLDSRLLCCSCSFLRTSPSSSLCPLLRVLRTFSVTTTLSSCVATQPALLPSLISSTSQRNANSIIPFITVVFLNFHCSFLYFVFYCAWLRFTVDPQVSRYLTGCLHFNRFVIRQWRSTSCLCCSCYLDHCTSMTHL